jgi:hypothetical protein
MDYKVKLTKCQNEHHHRGVFDTWTKWAKPSGQVGPGAGRSAQLIGWPTRVLVGLAQDLVHMSPRQFTRKDPRLEGGGG